jgi:hypothetical protein
MLTEPMLITPATYDHEERCPIGCDTSEAHERGDPAFRDEVAAASAFMRRDRGRRYDPEVRH